MKTCSVCEILKPLSDFSPSKNYKFGVSARCKICTAAYVKQWRSDNPQRTKTQSAKDNKTYWRSEARIKRDKRLKDHRRIYRVDYWAKNAERIKKHAAEYYQDTKEIRDAYNAAWRKANPQRWTAIHARWIAHKKGASLNDFTHEQWLEILSFFDHRCAYCPDDCADCDTHTHELTQDHVWPLSKGGPHTASNIVPACRSCNSRKHAGPVPTPVQPLLLTIAPAKKE